MPQYNIWTFLLIAFASQCLFLIIMFAWKRGTNKNATLLLLFLLGVIFLINLSNLISSAYIYREFPAIAGFARGMVLILGPSLYLYTSAILSPSFAIRPVHLLHFLPYILAFVIIRIQEGSVLPEITIAAIDSLMLGTVAMDWVSTLWFVAYCFHLLIYIFLVRRLVLRSAREQTGNYLIPFNLRTQWISRITVVLVLIALVFVGITGYIIYSGLYTIKGNFYYTIVLAALVYLIASQAMNDKTILVPGFGRKYGTSNITAVKAEGILNRIKILCDEEKIFMDPNLKIGGLAMKLGINAGTLSHIINQHFNKNFNEFVNDYRIREFLLRARQDEYASFSLFGIASEVGYRNKSSFNLAFKKKMGSSPSEYLKSIK